MANQEKPNKEDETHNEHIEVKVVGQNGSFVYFKIRRHVPLGRLINIYCKRHGLSKSEVKFRFDGNPIKPEDTPALLEMENGHQIDVFQRQTGGAS